MKNLVLIIIVVLAVWGASVLLGGDEYVGFYYPDENNLLNDIQSPVLFSSLEACRDWVDEQVSLYNSNDTGYDYECGKNCKLSSGKPYRCEETLK